MIGYHPMNCVLGIVDKLLPTRLMHVHAVVFPLDTLIDVESN
jgi:hypothetical protein